MEEEFAGWGAVAVRLVIFGVSAGAMGAAGVVAAVKSRPRRAEADAASEAILAKVEQDRKAADQATTRSPSRGLPVGHGRVHGSLDVRPERGAGADRDR